MEASTPRPVSGASCPSWAARTRYNSRDAVGEGRASTLNGRVYVLARVAGCLFKYSRAAQRSGCCLCLWYHTLINSRPRTAQESKLKSADFYRTKQQKLDLRSVFERVDVKKDSRIDAEELAAQFRALDYHPEPGEAQDIIWEVDDDHDGVLTWTEFQQVYERMKTDSYGREPRRLYNFIEFCLFDLDKSGLVGLNEVSLPFVGLAAAVREPALSTLEACC